MTFIVWQEANCLIAYDKSNRFLNIPRNEFHVITEEIEGYRPKMRVQFINFQNLKRKRKATQTKEGKIRIETRLQTTNRNKVTKTVKTVDVAEPKIELRFGGGSRAHFPYNRVVDFRKRKFEEATIENTTIEPTTEQISVTPSKWATESTITPNYSAEPALFLPSRFHKKENVVIVFKKHGKE